MKGKATTTLLSGALLVVGILLAGCATAESKAPGWTAQPGSSATAPASADASSQATASAGASPGATSSGVVFRVIQGYRYFGSYGITNLVGGADSKACQLQNVVQGLAGKGNYSFSDVRSLKAFAPDEKVAPAKAFDTLDQAAGYVNEGSEFANVQRMLMSLKIKN
jgi:hypothetical protein